MIAITSDRFNSAAPINYLLGCLWLYLEYPQFPMFEVSTIPHPSPSLGKLQGWLQERIHMVLTLLSGKRSRETSLRIRKSLLKTGVLASRDLRPKDSNS